MWLYVLIGIFIPFVGTTLGSGTVLFVRGEIRPKVQKALLGFASGVMIAASVWSLLLPAIEMAESGRYGEAFAWVPAAVGFLLGIGFLLLLDTVIPHLHVNSDEPEGLHGKKSTSLGKSAMLVLAVTLHNIPEGMAVGVLFAGMMSASESAGVSLAAALTLSVGIALQNIPEGAVISMPLAGSGTGKKKAFAYGVLSGIVEPAAALLTVLLTNIITPVLPYILSFAAGAMIYVVVEELIPESQEGKHSNIGTVGAAVGFVIMMVLDVALG